MTYLEALELAKTDKPAAVRELRARLIFIRPTTPEESMAKIRLLGLYGIAALRKSNNTMQPGDQEIIDAWETTQRAKP